KDANGNPVAGATVNWTTTGGTLDKTSSVTAANGVASAVLTSSTTPGTATVTATSGTAHGSTAVTFVAVAAATVTTTASPTSIVANGTSTSAISAVAKDAQDNPVPGVTVNWTTTAGTLDKTSSVTDANGVASAVLTSPTTVGTATVTATSGTAHGSTDVRFVAGPIATFDVTPQSSSVAGDGTSTAALRAVVKDAHGNVVPNASVYWLTNLGTLNNSGDMVAAQADANGVTTMSISSSSYGQAQVWVYDQRQNLMSAPVVVNFIDGVPRQISDYGHPETLIADGRSGAKFQMQVVDRVGVPVVNTRVTWTTTSGVLSSSSSMTDASGVASVTLTSAVVGPVYGTATVTGTTTTGASASAQVNVVPAPTASISATAPAMSNGGYTASITVTAKDENGNPLPNVPISWRTSVSVHEWPADIFDPVSGVTDAIGKITLRLTTGTIPGSRVMTVSGPYGTYTIVNLVFQ
ncbi:hypothetical protein ACVW0Y_002543, partial [Pseudomonas sp. TE3786]